MSVLNGHLYTFKEKCEKIEKSMLNLAGARKIKKEWKKREQKTKKIRKKFDGHLFAFDGHFGYKEEKCGIVQKSENFCLQF